ncbi:hypothetical protein EZV62_000446 [Acer yangbiense]|uniref:Uncharacterized protein n=1 Tax=Acer yangbiense TaxID=1000413 RepID=A0A5C7IR36_9ROSI|nr:hypothetical protein EZV62_000446 [Acer yangbiense]
MVAKEEQRWRWVAIVPIIINPPVNSLLFDAEQPKPGYVSIEIISYIFFEVVTLPRFLIPYGLHKGPLETSVLIVSVYGQFKSSPIYIGIHCRLLALGMMEYNTDWKAIQRRLLPCKISIRYLLGRKTVAHRKHQKTPLRDPALLRRQWRIALGTQKSYKQDAAKEEKRQMHELKRRCKTADLANWHLDYDKEKKLG